MYTQASIVSKVIKHVAKPTAFVAAFLLLIQPVAIVFAEEVAVIQESSQMQAAEVQVTEISTPEPRPVETTKKDKVEALLNTGLTKEEIKQKLQEWSDKDAANISEETLETMMSAGGGASKLTDTNTLNVRKLPESDPSNGSLLYSYAINLPSGRNDLTPSLSLGYNSNARTDVSSIGHGWAFDLPSIVRENKHGTENLYEYNDFSSSLSGEIVNTVDNVYAPSVDNGENLEYLYTGEYWIVKDKNGVVYKFGETTSARQDDSVDTLRIYRWMLEEVRDTNNNYIKYEYYKDAGQIYPSKIIYTGNGVMDGIFEVVFNRETHNVSPYMYDTDFPVKTNYRISSIEVKENGSWVRKYELTYVGGDAGYRSLVSTITESARDVSTGMISVKKPTIFTYKESEPITWTEDGEWDIPFYFAESGNPTMMKVADVNGDAYPDLVHKMESDDPDCVDTRVILNQADGTWYTANCFGGEWVVPVNMGNNDNAFVDSGARTFDYNGDQITDLIHAYSDFDGVNVTESTIFNGTTDIYNPWPVSGATSPIGFVFGSGMHADNATQVVDINADGLPDIVWGFLDDDGDGFSEESFIGNGNGWDVADSDEWHLPQAIIDENPDGGEVFTFAQFIDLNSDGLVDNLYKHEELYIGKRVSLNNGHNWEETEYWNSPFITQLNEHASSSNSDNGVRVFDVNGDGITDIVRARQHSGGGSYVDTDVYLNSGNEIEGFNYIETEDFPLPFAYGDDVTYTTVITDINADGMDDFVFSEKDGPILDAQTFLSNGTPFTDLLVGIEMPEGSTSEISYKLSTKYFDDGGNLLNPELPIAVTTVDSITTNDGVGEENIVENEYADGSYYFNNPQDRKFAGFGIVTNTDSEGNVTKTYYHQGNDSETALGEYNDHVSKIGMPYRVEEYDNADNLYRVTVNKWDHYNIGADHDFVKLVRTTTLAYDGDADHKDTAVEYTYDNATGNMLTKTDWGEVTASTDGSFTDAGSDKTVETTTYAVNAGLHILGLPSQSTVTDVGANKVRESKYFYDNLTGGSVNKGNLTKEQKWVTSTTYQTWKKSYNANGTVATSTDPRNKVTSYSYDTYGLYPTTVTNPLSQATSYTYDYSSGKPLTVTDPNGYVSSVSLDGFDRPLEEKIPDPTTTVGAQVTKTTYSYNDTTFPHSVTKNDYLDATISRQGVSYVDGFGRKVQTRVEMEDGNYAVSDIVYNDRGLVEKESLPYASTGSAWTTPTGTASLYTSYTYDAMKRPLTITNNLGTTANIYDQWTTTTTDPDAYVKDYTNDARGNLVTVVEHNGASTYTTSYEWNLNNLLTKITDALGNVRSFTYNGIGQRLSAEDLHVVGDATFGTWTYQYDASGNLGQSVSPKGDTVNYTYDDINRPTIENWTGGGGNEITYAYDSCSNGIGRLCTATVTGGVSTTYTYAPTGNIKNEVRTISGTGYTTTNLFDRQGNLVQVILPDTSRVRYTYNSAGLAELVERKETTGGWLSVLSDIDYAPTDQVSFMAYTNGVTTTNTYDATKLYRLTQKVSTKSGANVQDISYTYSPAGDITQIVDASATATSKTANYTYDPLHRLLTATITGVAGGTSAYTQTFTYNAIGNMTTLTGTGGTTFATTQYNGHMGGSFANPHAATKIAGVNRTYDQNGNMLTNGTLTNTWDYRNKLTQTVVGGNTVTYAYDHTGDRTSITDAGTTTIFPSQYQENTGANLKKYIYLGSTLLATVENNGGTITPHYAHADHLGGSSVMTSGAGAVDETIDYYPYGETRLDNKAGAFDERHKYTGYEFDATTGLNYAQARYQTPLYGRFISQDPMFWMLSSELLMDPQQMNSYSYARNNPIRNTDPTGLLSKDSIKSNVKKAINSFVSSVKNLFSNSGNTNTFINTAPTQNTEADSVPNTSPVEKTILTSPVGDAPITSYFKSDRSDCSICSATHGGTDYKVDIGTPVYAVAPGVVDRSYYSDSYGNTVIINHGPSVENSSEIVHTLYAHGSERLVEQGQSVEVNQPIMYSGNTGSKSTGPHLHFEVISTALSPFQQAFFGDLSIRHSPDELKGLLTN